MLRAEQGPLVPEPQTLALINVGFLLVPTMFGPGFALLWALSWTFPLTRGQLRSQFCNDRTVLKVESYCTSCAASTKMLCPKGSTKITSGMGTRGCTYTVDMGGLTLSLQGCSHTCQTVAVTPACCKGFWGTTCTECPGGKKPCGGHGTCQDGIGGNGTCICKVSSHIHWDRSISPSRSHPLPFQHPGSSSPPHKRQFKAGWS
ncbi:hypothetical protein XENTR_v10013048 [Xenopus tropicalis]|nr:hypothetical protein XENTR_v10013048 [Xenopus tropicalis]